MAEKPVQLVTNTQWSNDEAMDFLCRSVDAASERPVIGAAIITVQADGSIGTAWSAGDYNKFTMVGAIEQLKRDFMNLEIEPRG